MVVGLLTLGEAPVALVEDRNLTAHTYNESLVNAIFSRLAQHAMLVDRWLAALSAGGLDH